MPRMKVDIIQSGNNPDNERAFYESYAERKARTAAAIEKIEKKTGRPRSQATTPEGVIKVLKSYERTQSQHATAKECGCARRTVYRILNEHGIKRLQRRDIRVNTDYFEFYARIPGPLYRLIRTQAKLNNRKITKEIINALAKLYS